MDKRELIKAYAKAQEKEEQAKLERIELGEKLASVLGHPEEGQITHEIDSYKVTIKGVVNRRVDWAMFELIAAKHTSTPAPVKIKKELDTVGLKWIKENDPSFYLDLSGSITAIPGRCGIEIKQTKANKGAN